MVQGWASASFSKESFVKRSAIGQAWWFMPIIPPTQKAEVGGLQFEAGPGKVSMRSYLKNKLKAKTGLGSQLKW
jgi:hypothetical protein